MKGKKILAIYIYFVVGIIISPDCVINTQFPFLFISLFLSQLLIVFQLHKEQLSVHGSENIIKTVQCFYITSWVIISPDCVINTQFPFLFISLVLSAADCVSITQGAIINTWVSK